MMDPDNPHWFPDGEDPPAQGDVARLRARGMHTEADELERLRARVKALEDQLVFHLRMQAARDDRYGPLKVSLTDEGKP